MLKQPKKLAPEPHFSAYLALLENALLYIRLITSSPEKITPQQIREIHALADAIHNIPEFLLEHGHYFTEDIIREKIASFDEGFRDSGAQLGALLKESLAKAQSRSDATA